MSQSHVSRVRELYKFILRLHRSLPDDLKILGDNYAREEFKRHKKCKLQEAQIFLNEWREYAVAMSRQAAPGRGQKRPADEQAGPSREVRPADPRQAAARGEEVRRVIRPADPRQAAARGEEVRRVVRPADPRQAAARGEEVRRVVRPADPRQAAARGEEVRRVVRPADPRQDAARGGDVRREVRPAYQRQAAVWGMRAAAGAHPRLGYNLDEERISQLNPDQLLNLYNLLINARGEQPHPEYVNEPVDIGIELIETDIYAKSIDEAKKQITKIEEEERKQFLRGQIMERSFLSKKEYWFKRFERAQAKKDSEQLQQAINSLRITEKETVTATKSANIAKKESEKAKKIADEAQATAEKALAAYVKKGKGTKKLQEEVIQAKVKALKKVNECLETTVKAQKLAVLAKSKTVEFEAALDFTKELYKSVNDDLQKTNP